MAYVIGKPRVFEVSCLPAEVCVGFSGRSATDFIATFHDKAETVCEDLKVVEKAGKLCVVIPERMASCGPGKYYVSWYTQCVLCAQSCVRFKADCKPVCCEVTQEPTRKPRKKLNV